MAQSAPPGPAPQVAWLLQVADRGQDRGVAGRVCQVARSVCQTGRMKGAACLHSRDTSRFAAPSDGNTLGEIRHEWHHQDGGSSHSCFTALWMIFLAPLAAGIGRRPFVLLQELGKKRYSRVAKQVGFPAARASLASTHLSSADRLAFLARLGKGFVLLAYSPVGADSELISSEEKALRCTHPAEMASSQPGALTGVAAPAVNRVFKEFCSVAIFPTCHSRRIYACLVERDPPSNRRASRRGDGPGHWGPSWSRARPDRRARTLFLALCGACTRAERGGQGTLRRHSSCTSAF